MQVAAVDSRKSMLLSLESFQISHAHVRSILWSGDLRPSFHMCSEHTKPLIDLFKEKKFLLKSMPYARILISSLMVPHLNSVVFYYKTTLWSCLSWTTCSHVCSRTSSCFGACYRSSSPENPATSSRRFVLQTFIFLPRLDESGISWHQPDLNLRQIWWFGTFPKNYNIGPLITGKVDVVANTPSRKTYYCSILIEEVGHLPIRIS